jgi:hypothetical protein
VFRPCDYAQLWDSTDGSIYSLTDKGLQERYAGHQEAKNCSWFTDRESLLSLFGQEEGEEEEAAAFAAGGVGDAAYAGSSSYSRDSKPLLVRVDAGVYRGVSAVNEQVRRHVVIMIMMDGDDGDGRVRCHHIDGSILVCITPLSPLSHHYHFSLPIPHMHSPPPPPPPPHTNQSLSFSFRTSLCGVAAAALFACGCSASLLCLAGAWCSGSLPPTKKSTALTTTRCRSCRPPLPSKRQERGRRQQPVPPA